MRSAARRRRSVARRRRGAALLRVRPCGSGCNHDAWRLSGEIVQRKMRRPSSEQQ